MNSINNTSYRFKFVVACLFTLASCNFVNAQTRTPQNIRRVITTSSYMIENGQQKEPALAIEQELYDSLNRKHTDVYLDVKDHYPHNYKWHFFKGNVLYKTQIYENEKMKQVIEFTYTKNQIAQQNIKNVSASDTSLYLTLLFTNNANGKPTGTVAKNALGKVVYTSTSKYNSNGLEISRKVKAKKNIFPQDSILLIASKPVYDAQGRLSSQKVKTTDANKRTKAVENRYTYDAKNNPIGVLTLDEKGKQITRDEMLYHEKYENRIILVKHFDANNVLVKSLIKRYDVYPTDNHQNKNTEF